MRSPQKRPATSSSSGLRVVLLASGWTKPTQQSSLIGVPKIDRCTGAGHELSHHIRQPRSADGIFTIMSLRRILNEREKGDSLYELDLFDDLVQPTSCPKPNWTLSCCCGDEEVIFIALLFGYLLANFFLWNNLLLRPMKLIAIFVHEMSHALACWLTGGTVLNNRIEVYESDGGITRYEGGNRYFILSAGYIGSAFFGMLCVILSGDRIASLVTACIFLFGLVISLYYTKKSETESKVWTVGLSVGFIGLTTVFILLDRFLFHPLLQFLTLYYGVFIASFAIYDLYDDIFVRAFEQSDTYTCNELIPCCLPRYAGLLYIFIALGLLALGLYFALVWMVSTATT